VIHIVIRCRIGPIRLSVPAATPRTERAIGLLSVAILVLILLGHRAWKLPSKFGRALPNVDIEGEQPATTS